MVDIAEQMYRRYAGQIYKILVRTQGDEEFAKDVTSETFLKATKAVQDGKYQDRGQDLAWLMRIATNTVINFKRKPSSREIPIDSTNAYSMNVTLAGSRDDGLHHQEPEKAYGNSEGASEAVEALKAIMSEQFYTTYLLYEAHGFSYKEIMEITGAPLGTVMSRLSRARGFIKDHLPDLERKILGK